MEKIGIIINPNAKKNKLKKKLSPEYMQQIGGEYVDIQSPVLENLDKTIADFKNRGIPYIGIAGGDGTIHNVVTSMMNVYNEDSLPPILLLKGGTMDNIAKTVKLKGIGYYILKRFVTAINENKELEIHERDTMKINDKYCFLFGIGMVTNFLNEAYKDGKKGFKNNFIAAMKAIKHCIKEPEEGSIIKGIDGKVITDGKPIDFSEVRAILAGSVEQVAQGIPMLYKANDKDGTFHVIITGLPPIRIITKLLKIVLGKEIRHPKHYDNIISSLKIKCDKPFQYTMDGDLYHSDGMLEVSLGPRIKLISV